MTMAVSKRGRSVARSLNPTIAPPDEGALPRPLDEPHADRGSLGKDLESLPSRCTTERLVEGRKAYPFGNFPKDRASAR